MPVARRNTSLCNVTITSCPQRGKCLRHITGQGRVARRDSGARRQGGTGAWGRSGGRRGAERVGVMQVASDGLLSSSPEVARGAAHARGGSSSRRHRKVKHRRRGVIKHIRTPHRKRWSVPVPRSTMEESWQGSPWPTSHTAAAVMATHLSTLQQTHQHTPR